MSIFTKAINKFQQNSNDPVKHKNTYVDMRAQNKEATDHGYTLYIEGKAQYLSSQIDIPLDQELTETHGVINFSNKKYNDLDIDIDLAVGSDGNTMLSESQVMSINPFRPFSNPVDLNLKKLEKDGFINPDNADTLLSNTFRMIKRPLLKNVMGKGASVVDNANLIMVTSSLDGEGKSFSAINLAISIAMEKNKHVLLIDADVNKPSHHQIFDLQMKNGLTDLLIGKVGDMSRVLCRTNIPSLSLMFAGNHVAHATELLASESMDNFVEEISSRYPDRIIIFDSPPLLLTTEASVLASHMGQVVVVIEAEKTLKQIVQKSVSLLSNEIVLMLLNKVRDKNEVGNYGYYGYGHQS